MYVVFQSKEHINGTAPSLFSLYVVARVGNIKTGL